MAFENIYDVSDLFNKEGDLITKKIGINYLLVKKCIILPKRDNWVGEYPDIKLIILTSKNSIYKDGWMDQYRHKFCYYLMINHRHTPKAVLEGNKKKI